MNLRVHLNQITGDVRALLEDDSDLSADDRQRLLSRIELHATQASVSLSSATARAKALHRELEGESG